MFFSSQRVCSCTPIVWRGGGRVLPILIIAIFLTLFASVATQALASVTNTAQGPASAIQGRQEALIVGSEQDYPPFATGMTDDTAGGFTVDLWKAVAAEAGLDYTICVLPFHQVLQRFKEGKVNVLINLAISDERRQFADFSVPHVTVHGAIFVRKGKSGIHTEDDLAGKSIIVLKADLAHDYAVSKGWAKQLVLVDTAAEGMRLLASGKHDAMLLSKLAGMLTLQATKLTNIKALKVKARFSQKFAFAVPKGQPELLSKLNEGLALAKSNGTYDALYEKWFGIYEVKEVGLRDLMKYIIPLVVIFLCFAGYVFYRRQVERKEAERKYRDLYDHAPDMFLSIDVKSAAIIDCNQTLLNITGYSREEVVGRSMNELYHADCADQVRVAFQTFMANKEVLDAELQLRCKNGNKVYVSMNASAVCDEHGRALRSRTALRDITERKQAEKALLKVKEQFSNFLESSRDVIAMMDTDYKYTLFNNAFHNEFMKIFGKDLKLGDSMLQALEQHPEDLANGKEYWNRAFEGEDFTITQQFGDAKLERNWYELRFSPIRDSEDKVVGAVHIVRNTTERKQMEERLRVSATRFKAIINASPVPKALNDDNMNVTLLNPAFIRTFGYTLEDIPTLESWWTRAFPDHEYRQYIVDAWRSRLEKAKKDGSEFEPLEANIRCKDGTVRTVMADAAPLGESFAGEHLVILIDLTDRIKIEESLRNSKIFVESIIDQSPINMWISDDKGVLIRANKALREQLKVTDDEIVGKYNIFDDPIIEEHGFMPQVHDVFDNGHTARFTIAYDTSLNGNLHLENTSKSTLEVTISPVINSEGKVTNAIIQHLDIGELKLLEENLRAAMLAAESANRAKSEFLANMSHEIRTPMNGVLGMAHLLEMTSLTIEQREYIEALKLSGKNLLSVITDILDLSKIEAGKIIVESAEFSLHHCINDVVLMLKTVAYEKRLTLDLKLSKDIPILLVGDQLRIKQILLNLLGNAVKFTAQGHVTISTKIVEQQDNFVLLQIAVRDSGIGISPESLDTIFRPFIQEDGSFTRKYGGTGLGLTISLRLAELMGGTIRVESSPGVGSCFTVTLPFSVGRDTANIQTAPSKTTVGWDGPPLRILFAEDDQVNIKFGATLLKKWGLDVIVVEDGRECLTALEQGTFDLVLMDIQMPVMNGEEALREIRSKEQGTNNHQPVIAMTAYSMHGDMERFLGVGFDGYVAKPLITSDLVVEIKRAMGLSGEVSDEIHG